MKNNWLLLLDKVEADCGTINRDRIGKVRDGINVLTAERNMLLGLLREVVQPTDGGVMMEFSDRSIAMSAGWRDAVIRVVDAARKR